MSLQPFTSDSGFDTVGNISANYILGNGSQLTGITAISNYGNANVAAYLPTIPVSNVVMFVDVVNGNDTFSGSALGPKKTIANAIASMSNSAGTIYLEPGTYTEDWTYSGSSDVSFDGSGYGSQVNLTGNIVFNHTATSCDLAGVSIANLTHNGTGELYLFQNYFQKINHTGSGKLSAETCIQIDDGNILLQGGNVTISNSTIANLILNNTTAVVDVYSVQGVPKNVEGWQVQAGSILLKYVNFLPATNGGQFGNAVSVTSAASPSPGVAPVFFMEGTSVINPDGSSGNIAIGTNAFWSIASSTFNSTTSQITSPYNLDSVYKFDSALFFKNITVGQSAAPGATGNIVMYGSLLQASTANSSFTGNLSAAKFTSANSAFTSSTVTTLNGSTGTFSTLVNVTSATAATTTTTGSLKTAGGLGVVGNAIIGGNSVVTGNITGANFLTAGIVKTTSKTVATLPTAAAAGAGARSFVSDANNNVFNAAVVGGGSNNVPVFSTGAGWFIG